MITNLPAWQGHREDDGEELTRWLYRPKEPTRSLSQQAMPVHINLWLFKGLPPKNSQEVEVIFRAFKFAPVSALPSHQQQ